MNLLLTVVESLQDPRQEPYKAVWVAPNRLTFRADTAPQKGLRGSAFLMLYSLGKVHVNDRRTPRLSQTLDFERWDVEMLFTGFVAYSCLLLCIDMVFRACPDFPHGV